MSPGPLGRAAAPSRCPGRAGDRALAWSCQESTAPPRHAGPRPGGRGDPRAETGTGGDGGLWRARGQSCGHRGVAGNTPLLFQPGLSCRQLRAAGTRQCAATSCGRVGRSALCVVTFCVGCTGRSWCWDTARGDGEVTRGAGTAERGQGCSRRLLPWCRAPRRRLLSPTGVSHRCDPGVTRVAAVQPVEAYQPRASGEIRAGRKPLSATSTCPQTIR